MTLDYRWKNDEWQIFNIFDGKVIDTATDQIDAQDKVIKMTWERNQNATDKDLGY